MTHLLRRLAIFVLSSILLFPAVRALAIEPKLESLPSAAMALDANITQCSCTQASGITGHLDPVCAVTKIDCAAAKTSCGCVPENLLQVADFTAVIPRENISPLATLGFATLCANNSTFAQKAIVLITDAKGTSAFAIRNFSFTTIDVHANTRSVIRAFLFDYFNIFLNAPDATVRFLATGAPAGRGIDDALRIGNKGKDVFVQGPLECPTGQKVRELWVNVTQEATGAFARAVWRGTCTGNTQIWKVTAHVRRAGKGTFAPGIAQLCAAATFKANGNVPQTAKQWCTDAILFEN